MVAEKLLIVYPNALNSSLEQSIEPLAEWEVVVQYCYAVIFITTLTQSYLYWNRFGRNSQGLLKVSLLGLLATASMHIPLSFIAVSQFFSPAHWPYDVAQCTYCNVMAVSAGCARQSAWLI
jgi:hypothetical protein